MERPHKKKKKKKTLSMMNAEHHLPQSLLEPPWLVVGRWHVQQHEQKKRGICIRIW